MSEESFETILFGHAGDVATITLNRADKLNSVNRTMHAELRVALDRVATSGARCLVLTGAGRGFCAGQDLAERRRGADDAPPDLGAGLDTLYNPLVRRLRALPLPTVAAVNGIAAGAGANLALACDIAVAARSASFVQAFARIGLVPDCGGTWFLPHLVGRARALALAMTAERLPAERAAEWGLIWSCVDDADLAATVAALAASLAALPTGALVATRRAIDAATTNDLDTQLDLERDLQREAGRSADYREGVTAFLEKRAPRFTGR
ncbi:MAG: 2-(1,2-epoxy-1,2-dihydrophenyl)acetyl-CoA isomerase [Alphaproteobacteria bacterium]|nr:2-(1,2-epoxy-1,2-dihydrophenyl)acetyl-CoA isomerase [Alphaproteobacteria bacterium]